MAEVDTATRPPASAPPPAKRSELSETIRFLLKLALIVWLFRSFVFAPFSIPSESMLPRLLIGDYLFVSKWNYGYSRWSMPFGVPPVPGRVFASVPARGDTVVFRSKAPDDHDVIKRVIGLPGDTIQMRQGQLILNGQAIPKQRVADFIVPLSPNFSARECDAEFIQSAAGTATCRIPRFRETLPGGRSYDVLDQRYIPDADDTALYTVPAGNVFLMGDNRDDSADSRFPSSDEALPGQPQGMGFIPLDRVQGKAVIIFWSTDGSANWLLPWTWITAARWDRLGRGFD
ncbi:signal peptidase I [Sphingomonas radiodurans]|uniref:signal peptidase I n=1 Tax=Sphingomonas radiodurans TaxID=2890321 RepID=UPI001E29DB21|nr:signal peptidase I [Sphingomonas radiodurans]WBH16202.1 signal peptidase I [Sphingomonas radiodurans]